MEAVVLFEYEKQQDDELDLEVGTTITNVTTVDDGWCEGTYGGKTGLFPDNFVQLKPVATPPPVVTTTSKPPPPNPTPSEPPVITRATAQKTKTRRAKVTFSYAAENPDELSLEPGQAVEVLGEEEDGWWRGKTGSHVGLFPSNFVEIISEETTPPSVLPPEPSHPASHITTDGPPQVPPDRHRPPVGAGVGTGMGLPRFNPAEVKLKSTAVSHPPPPAKEKEQPKRPTLRKALPPKAMAAPKPPAMPPHEPPLEKAKVVFAYKSEREDELTIETGDILEVVDKSEQDGWWKVKLNGKAGLVPDNFVELLPSQPADPAEPPPKKEPRRPPPAPGLQEAQDKSNFGVPATEPLDSSAVKDRAHRPVGTVRPPSRSNLHQDESEPAPAEDGGQAPWQKELKLRKKKEPVKTPVAKPPVTETDKKPQLPKAGSKPSIVDKAKPKPPPVKPSVDTAKPAVSSTPRPTPPSPSSTPRPTPPSPSSTTKPPSKPSDTSPSHFTPPQSSDAWEEALEKLREEFTEFKVQIRKEIKTLSADLDEERKTNASLRIDIDRLKKTQL